MTARRLPQRAQAQTVLSEQLRVRSFAYFMHELRDPLGNPLAVAAHHRRWCSLIESNDRLVLLAPRDHGKTTVALAYLLWRFWCHGRDAQSGQRLTGAAGPYEAVVFSATRAQAEVFVAKFRELLAANPWLFEPTDAHQAHGLCVGLARSARHIQFANGAELRSRVFGTEHPRSAP